MIALISLETLDAVGFETVKILLSLLWQSSILLGAVGLLTYALRHRRASLRHQLWVAALLITPVLPLLSWIASQAGTPQVQIPLVPAYAARRPQAETGPAEFTAADIKTARPSADSSSTSPRGQIDAVGSDAAVPSPLTQSPSREEVSTAGYPWAIVLLIYLCGLGVFVLLMVAGLLRIGKYIRQGRIITEPRITGLFNAARRKLGHTRGCVVIETEAIQIPMTIRTFYPIVALPKDFASVLSNSEWRTVALHEVAHIKRNDPLLLSIVSVLRAVLFFHPLVWLAAREIFTLSEEATDDMVLEVVNKPLPYAKMLTRLTETLSRRMLLTELAVGIVFSKSVLLRRIEAILSDRSEQLRQFSRWTLAMTLAVAFGSLFLAIAVPLTSPGSTTPRHAAGMVQRHLWSTPPMSALEGGISPDGRYLSYVDGTAGNLAVRDLTTEASWLLTKNTTWENLDGWAYKSVISPDGRQIAYTWFNEKGLDFYDLRIIDMDGSNMRVLYHDASIFYIVPYDWSPDSKEILAYFSDADKSLVDEKTGELFRKGYLVLVSVADGSVQVLKTWYEHCWPKRAVFSPDGRYVAYDFGLKDDLTRRDIFLMDLDGGGEIPLIEHPADDRLFGWAPDGRRILFASYRTSERSLWVIDIDQGAAQEPPRLLKEVFVNGSPIGFTSDGSYYYGISTTASNVYLARFDPKGLNFEEQPELVSSQHVGTTTMGDFSLDGKFLVYKAGRAGHGPSRWGPADWMLVIYSVETGQERILTPSPSFLPGTPMSGPRFSPDGRSLLVSGSGRDSGKGIYTVDVETGTVKLIARGRTHLLIPAVWSPDGESIYVCRQTSLSRLELATGRETTLYIYKGPCPWDLDVSPDGQWLAFYRSANSLMVVSSGGDEPREVAYLDEPAQDYPFVSWTPDGEHLLFSKHNNELWKVNVETGEQQQIGPAIENLVDATMHPDGRQITFTVEQKGSELWVMENFLPE